MAYVGQEASDNLLDDKNGTKRVQFADMNISPSSMYPDDSVVRDEPTRYTYGSPVPAWRIPSDYFILAVISTVLCFWPIGIFALWKSREVYRSSSRGDLDGAWQASSSARFLSWTAFVIGLAILIISVVLIIVHHDEIDIDIDV